MTYTAKQLRHAIAAMKAGEPMHHSKAIELAVFCADLLDWKASIEAAQGEDVRKTIAALHEASVQFDHHYSLDRKAATLLESLSAKLAECEAEVARLKAHRIGLNDDGSLDEVVGSPAHLEQMDDKQWFALIGDVAVFLTSQSPIQATYERRDYPEGTK